MKYAILLAMLMTLGCGKKPEARAARADHVTTAEEKMEPIARLKLIAGKRHFYWKIFCIASDEADRYQAEASSDPPELFFKHIEDGAKGMWAETGTTQQEAALLLAISLETNEQPPMPADHRKLPSTRHRQCAPTIAGGPK